MNRIDNYPMYSSPDSMFKSPMGNNVGVPMTRRIPDLPQKVLYRDSEFFKKLMKVWDENQVSKNTQAVLDLYLKECKNLSDERYWEIMRSVWIICGSISNAPIFRKLMQANRRNKYYFSTPEEAKALRELQEPISAYRACNDENGDDGGLSWTISRHYAEKYAEIYNKEYIIMRNLMRKDVFAYIDRNNEFELIIL